MTSGRRGEGVVLYIKKWLEGTELLLKNSHEHVESLRVAIRNQSQSSKPVYKSSQRYNITFPVPVLWKVSPLHSIFSPYWHQAIFLSVPDCTAHQSLSVAIIISSLLVYNKQTEVSSSPSCRVHWTVIDFAGIKNVKMAVGQTKEYFLKWHDGLVSAIQMGKAN